MELINGSCLVSQATSQQDRLDSCPVYWDECRGNLTSLTLGPGPAIVSIVSSSLSCIGSLLIVYIYARWRDLRTGSRSIITFLAIADFFTAFGYVVGSSNYLVHLKNDTDPASSECLVFTDICQLQSYVTTWSSMSSFFWTFALAFYLYLTIVRNRVYLATRLIPLFHVIAWALPIAICLPLLVTGYLGFAPFGASTWCFIYDLYRHGHGALNQRDIALVLVAGKLWEILTYVAVVILYTAIKLHIRKETRKGESSEYLSSELMATVQKADRKLTFIPIMFIFLRIWGTIQFFYSIGVSPHLCMVPPEYHHHTPVCAPENIFIGFVVLGYFQAIGDGGQGWGNVILYVITSAKIRQRLFGWMMVCSRDSSQAVNHPINRTFKERPNDYAAISNVNNSRGTFTPPNKAMVHYTPDHTREPSSTNTHEPTTDLNTSI